jgi:signal transduction histidine kinase/ligand-binding sensor domain-containing protein
MLLCSLFVASVARAGDRRPASEDFDIWQPEDAGQQNPITAIVQSKEGYLWLGTYHGLVRFDGVRSTVFDSGNSPGLQNGVITSLFESTDGVLWIGHETGQVTRFAQGTFEPVKLDKTWPGDTVEAITSDGDGDLWLLNNTGVLFRLRDGKTVMVPGGASPTRKAALTRSLEGRPWLVCGGQVAMIEHGCVTPFQFEDTSSGDYYERVLPACDGGLWVLVNQRLRKWRQGRWTAELDGCPHMPGGASVLLETRAGDVLAGTLRDGLYLFGAGGQTLHFSRTNGLSSDWVRSLYEDREGNIWVGTAAGLDGLRMRQVHMLSAPDGFKGCGVLSFWVSGTNSAWVGTEGAGLYRYTDGQWTSFTEPTGVANPFVWSVIETREKELFIGTWGGGLMVKRGERFETPRALSQITAAVVSLYQGRGGELWIGTTIGLYRYERGNLAWFAGKERLAFPDIRAITESSDGTIWFGMSGGGLASLRGEAIKQFRKEDGVGSDFVVCLYADPDGTIWAGTSDGGLTRIRRGRFATINSKQGLPSNVIYHIVDDGDVNLWLSTQRGIWRASKDELNRCADGAIQSVGWLGYGKAEGLASQTCSGGFQPGAARAADGRIWFPTPKGLAIVDPANVITNNSPPPVVIEEMLADEKPVDLRSAHRFDSRSRSSDAVRIPPGKQRFQIHYTALSFVSPDKVQFKYRLKGREEQWNEVGTKRVADYTYLRPGSYYFQVIACNNNGLWNEDGAALGFIVLPYFWQTWWFEASSGLFVAGALGAGVFSVSRRRVRRKLEETERQHAMERERARIARDIHDDLGASLTRITMLSQSVLAELNGQTEAMQDVDQIYSTARELTRAMDEIVWAVNPKHDTLDSLVNYLGRFGQHFLSAAGIRCRLDVPVYLPSRALTSEIRHNVFLAFKEALHNVVKHAAATEVRISLQLEPGGFVLSIADNGHGFDWNSQDSRPSSGSEALRLSSGNGVLNMQKRLEAIGGRCEWNTAPGEGARVKLVVKTHDS